ncbi:MAG: hypothetical protein ACI97A_002706 [Planctomycetota bacterium]|jgi:hypothetical protein
MFLVPRMTSVNNLWMESHKGDSLVNSQNDRGRSVQIWADLGLGPRDSRQPSVGFSDFANCAEMITVTGNGVLRACPSHLSNPMT